MNNTEHLLTLKLVTLLGIMGDDDGARTFQHLVIQLKNLPHKLHTFADAIRLCNHISLCSNPLEVVFGAHALANGIRIGLLLVVLVLVKLLGNKDSYVVWAFGTRRWDFAVHPEPQDCCADDNVCPTAFVAEVLLARDTKIYGRRSRPTPLALGTLVIGTGAQSPTQPF